MSDIGLESNVKGLAGFLGEENVEQALCGA